ncbi:MAG: putative DNA binding domain-containing protein, partial [Chloroflexota bacterium]|nr:putative DNA binding domain-containing protein [Chloroflexota bacterium]
MDLHLHTPASADFRDRGASYLQWLQRAEACGLDIIALTDHNSVAGWAAMYREVETLIALNRRGRLTDEEKHSLAEYGRLAEKMMVLPGFEVTATLGFHVLGIFPQGTSVRKLEHILLDLNIPEDKLELGVGEVGSTSDVLTVYKEIAEAGGIAIAAHANSTHGVALQGFDFGGQTKIAYTQDKNLHSLEVTDLVSTSRRRTANFFNGSKPEYPRRMHCIQGSDAHRLVGDPRDKSEPWGIGDRVTEVYLPEVSFDALKELFVGSDFGRTRPAQAWGGPVVQPVFDEVKAARKQGPNLIQSFHEHYSGKPGRMAAIIADVVAMANTNGGTVYIGVNASPKPAVTGVEKPEEVITLVTSELQKATTPMIGATLEVVQTEGKPVILIKVPKGADTPYMLGTGQIYVRQESETGLAMRDELIRLVLASHLPGFVQMAPVTSAAPPVPTMVVPPAPAGVPAPATRQAPPIQPRQPVQRPAPLPPRPLPPRPVVAPPRIPSQMPTQTPWANIQASQDMPTAASVP